MPKLCRCWSERYSAVDARWSDDFVCPRCGDFFFSFFFASFLMTAALSMRPTSMSGDGAAHAPTHQTAPEVYDSVIPHGCWVANPTSGEVVLGAGGTG